MKHVILLLIIALSGCTAKNKLTFFDIPPETPISDVARIYNTTSGIRIVAIDRKEYKKGSFEFLNDEIVYMSPGRHTISIEFCICSADGSTYIEGVHTFDEVFIAGHDYGLVFNYAPPDRHEFWLSHVYLNKNGRQKKELQAKLGPFEIKRTSNFYVPINL